MRALLASGLTLVLGCGSALDIDRARALLRRPAPAPALELGAEKVELSAPTRLRSYSGRLRAIALSWDPVLDGEVAGYVVERSLGPGERFEFVAAVNGRFETSFVDRGSDLAAKRGSDQALTGLGDGEAYSYRVRAFRSDGRLGVRASPATSGHTAPAPESPEGLRAYSHLPRHVALSWRPVDDPTVAGYVVYRSPSAGGEFREIARLGDAYDTSYVDDDLGALRVFYYRISAVNAAGGEGLDTEPVRAVTKAEPLPPVGLAVVDRRLGAIRVRWDANVEGDLSAYRLLRRRAGSDEAETVTEVGPEETQAEDPEVGAGEPLHYHVVAIDADGLESSPSEPIRAEGVGYGLRARAEDGGVRLSWDPAVAAELSTVRILRVGRLRSREIGRAAGTEFLDQEAGPGGRYRYQVVGVRPDGSQAPSSRTAEAEVPESVAAPAH